MQSIFTKIIMNKAKKAFSLVELSIVVLIIGIVIVGITQSTRLVAAFKINSARTLTKHSPVAEIDGLVMWLDSTAEESLAVNEDQDGGLISAWYDINPRSNAKNHLAQATSGNRPTYKASAINNLPALQFNGTNKYLATSYSEALNSPKFTIFAVTSAISYVSDGSVASSLDSVGFGGYALYASNSGSYEFWVGNASAWSGQSVYSSAITTGKASLLTGSYNGSSRNFYENGVVKTSAATTFAANPEYSFFVGASNVAGTPSDFYNGYIGEIILFNRTLQLQERKAIEDYLRKKWSII